MRPIHLSHHTITPSDTMFFFVETENHRCEYDTHERTGRAGRGGAAQEFLCFYSYCHAFGRVLNEYRLSLYACIVLLVWLFSFVSRFTCWVGLVGLAFCGFAMRL
ncbi:hypothetical protein BU16DRAFT_391453 [Lophium mytilinum]|uniref:Uncharacterized protein n=1 Tax=Lophium mytilinum TaxID=390894 RepID=A0A6A6QSL9_9PEZI|nr:hypothetical protein BU16DRAFT_391453 [Lophium mytilinum]